MQTLPDSTCFVELRNANSKTIKEIPLDKINKDSDGVKKYLAREFNQPHGPDVLFDSKYIQLGVLIWEQL